MTTSGQPQGTRFLVDLGTLTLPPGRARMLETAIRDAVLKALAGLDLAAPGPLSERTAGDSAFALPPGILYGLIFDPDALPDPPPVIPDIDEHPF